MTINLERSQSSSWIVASAEEEEDDEKIINTEIRS
jgi:hypothetical protein